MRRGPLFLLAGAATLVFALAPGALGKGAVKPRSGKFAGGGVAFRVAHSKVTGLTVRARMFCSDGSSYRDTFTQRRGDQIRVRRGRFHYAVHDGPVAFDIRTKFTRSTKGKGSYIYATNDSVNDCNTSARMPFKVKRR